MAFRYINSSSFYRNLLLHSNGEVFNRVPKTFSRLISRNEGTKAFSRVKVEKEENVSKRRRSKGRSQRKSRSKICSEHDVVGNEMNLDENVITVDNQHDRLAEVMTPWANMPYEDQLLTKWEKTREIFVKLKQERLEEEMPSRLKLMKCKVHRIVSSPACSEYLNRDEFTIKQGIDGNPKTVGFVLGKPSKGTAVCVSPEKLINIKTSHKRVARHFQSFIRQSELPACDTFSDGGFWRGIRLISNEAGDIMATVVAHPQNFSMDELEHEKSSLSSYFALGPGQECNLKSLYFQACPHTRCTREQAPFEHLFGEPNIYENIGLVQFCISPDSTFYLNTSIAAHLVDVVHHLSKVDPDTILLDVCSGMGTLSLPLASHVRQIIGIDAEKQAINDANRNCELNDIKNATYLFGKVEHILPDIVSSLDDHKIVVLTTNPSNGALRSDAVKAIRKFKNLNHIIYVSCKPDGVDFRNFLDLGKPPSGKLVGHPFIPTEAVPVDILPHTKRCDMMVLLQRTEIL